MNSVNHLGCMRANSNNLCEHPHFPFGWSSASCCWFGIHCATSGSSACVCGEVSIRVHTGLGQKGSIQILGEKDFMQILREKIQGLLKTFHDLTKYFLTNSSKTKRNPLLQQQITTYINYWSNIEPGKSYSSVKNMWVANSRQGPEAQSLSRHSIKLSQF